MQHGRELPGNAVREPDRLCIYLDPSEDGARNGPEERVPEGSTGPHRRVAPPKRSPDTCVTLSIDDRLEVFDLLARADNAATRRDVETYVALFTDDGVLDGEKGEHRGRSELADAVAKVWATEAANSFHLTLNIVIDDVADDKRSATATSALLVVAAGPPPTVLSVSTIIQRLEQVGTAWRIARRTVG